MNEPQVLTYIKGLAEKAESQKNLAISLGISDAYLSDILNKRRPLSDEFLAKIGLERITTYRRKSP